MGRKDESTDEKIDGRKNTARRTARSKTKEEEEERKTGKTQIQTKEEPARRRKPPKTYQYHNFEAQDGKKGERQTDAHYE